MKLLYVSSYHPTLEYDDLKLFTEMGVEWFSTGPYIDPKNPVASNVWRGPIDYEVDPQIKKEFLVLNPVHAMHRPINLTRDFVNKFDIVLCNFSFAAQGIIDDIWEPCLDVPLLYRTYSQQFAPFEAKLKQYRDAGAFLVRGSTRESTIGNYAGHDFIIRCYVDEHTYKGWTGEEANVLTFANDFSPRMNHPNFECYRTYYRKIKPFLPTALFGNDTEIAGGGGYVSWEDQLKRYRSSRVYFSIGSPPATLTYNFLEAWSTGMPVVTFGSKLGNGVGYATHEPPFLITNEVDGFCSDDTNEIIDFCNYLLEDYDAAKKIGEAGRKRCIQEFSKEKVKNEWLNIFSKVLGHV